MNLRNIFLCFGVLTFSFSASAEILKDESSIAIDGVLKKTNSLPQTKNVDDLLTNNRLRAISGSVSRWSIASQLNYNGGSVLDPLSQDRPNIAAASATTIKSGMEGSVSVKYGLSSQNSLLAGIGTRWIAPFQSGTVTHYKGTTFDIMNPYLTFQHVYRWSGIQSILQFMGMQWTQSDQTALGYSRLISVSQENLYAIGKTGLSLGIYGFLQYQFFNKSGSYGNPSDQNYIADLASVQSQYAFGISPYLEYQISKALNFRTVVGLLTYEHYASYESPFRFFHNTVYQSMGLGIAIARDVFLYPNIQFLPGHLTAALTNVGLSATINFF